MFHPVGSFGLYACCGRRCCRTSLRLAKGFPIDHPSVDLYFREVVHQTQLSHDRNDTGELAGVNQFIDSDSSYRELFLYAN